jgi:flagellar protein FlaG
MEAKLRQVQPAMVESWMLQDHGSRDSLVIQATEKSQANQGAKSFVQGKKTQEGNKYQGDLGEIKKLFEEVRSYLDNLSIQLSFDIHDKTGEMVVQVLDRETGELIRQMPSDELLDLQEKLKELRGVLFDRKA